MADSHLSPFKRFTSMLRVERQDLAVLTVYAFAVVALTLIVPLAMQALVNTVAAGLFAQPIIILTLLVLAGLIVASVIQIFQLRLVETLQQRIFAQTAIDVVDRLARVKTESLRDTYVPEVVNRFFDVLTVQKALSKLLLDGLGAVVQAATALVVLGLYNPFLLLLGMVLTGALWGGTFLLGYGGLRSSIQESIEKYRVASWIQDIARCHGTLKVHGDPDFAVRNVDGMIGRYLDARTQHFRVVARQHAGAYAVTAIATPSVLAIGGVLVLNGELSIGQLVAAQILITLVLTAMEKLVKQSELFYDLLTGLDKVGHVLELDIEDRGGRALPEPTAVGAAVSCRNLRFGYNPDRPVLDGFDLELKPGDRISLVGASGAGKSTIAALLCGFERPSQGSITIDGYELHDIDLTSLRRQVALVGYEREVLPGTLYDNITLGRTHVSHEDVRWAVEVAQLAEEIAQMPAGLQTVIVSGGGNLSGGQIQRLLIARAIVDRPRLLILDEAFTGLDERMIRTLLDRIFSPEHAWTIIDISHQPDVVVRADTVHVLAGGRIGEHGPAGVLSRNPSGFFSQLFPYLSRTLREHPVDAKSSPRRAREVLA
jgi:ATP-binding cassette subfamily B protein